MLIGSHHSFSALSLAIFWPGRSICTPLRLFHNSTVTRVPGTERIDLPGCFRRSRFEASRFHFVV